VSDERPPRSDLDPAPSEPGAGPHEETELSVAIDLSRRKSAPPPDLVRESILGARREAGPYVTMTRIALTQLARSRVARLGSLMLACLGFVAILADVLASDLPLACRWRGVLYLMPAVTRPTALGDEDCTRMERDHSPGDWQIPPLVAYGPSEVSESRPRLGEAGDVPSGDEDVLLPPLTHGHPFGTDRLGRDLFARVVHGTRTALGQGLVASFVLVAIGVALGALAGFLGGLIDAIVARSVEALTAIPTLVLVLVVGALVPHPTTATLLWTIALTRWTELARLVRAEVLLTLGSDHVSAARALGASPLRVLRRHVMPNAIGPAIVAAAFGVASVVVVEAAVDFLHVGSPDTMASWGESLGEARAHPQAWWLVAFPAATLLTTLVALNLVGEAARDALDPRLRGVGGELTEGMRG
jgi:peptide/nickel transport system permease protein